MSDSSCTHLALIGAVLPLLLSACDLGDEKTVTAPKISNDVGTVVSNDAGGASDTAVDAGSVPSIDAGTVPRFDAGPRPVPCPAGATKTWPTKRPSVNACPAVEPPWYAKGKAPKPSLDVEMGTYDQKTKTFTPYIDGQWARVHFGMRTGAGVWSALRVKLPGETAAMVGLNLDVPGHVGCKQVGETVTKLAYFKRQEGQPGVYIYGAVGHPGACVLIKDTYANINQYCRAWMTITASVRIPDTDTWGQTAHVVRLYIDP